MTVEDMDGGSCEQLPPFRGLFILRRKRPRTCEAFSFINQVLNQNLYAIPTRALASLGLKP
jgi:hypothetical protein